MVFISTFPVALQLRLTVKPFGTNESNLELNMTSFTDRKSYPFIPQVGQELPKRTARPIQKPIRQIFETLDVGLLPIGSFQVSQKILQACFWVLTISIHGGPKMEAHSSALAKPERIDYQNLGLISVRPRWRLLFHKKWLCRLSHHPQQ